MSRGGKSPKRKGSGAEREVVAKAWARGLAAERARGSNGRALGQADTCDVLLADRIAVQVKRRKSLPAYLTPPEGATVLATRGDGGEWLCLLTLDDLLDLIGGAA